MGIEHVFMAYFGLLGLMGVVFAAKYKEALELNSEEAPTFKGDIHKVMDSIKSGKVILVDSTTKKEVKLF